MTQDGKRNVFLLMIFLLVGGFSWSMRFRAPLEFDTSPLASLPQSVGNWDSRDIPLEENVESMLRADFNLQRIYRSPFNKPIWLYIGYYGTARGGKPEHTPDVCYKASGWQIVSDQTVPIDREQGFRAREFVVEKEGERRLVNFWFRSSRRSGIPTTNGLRFDHLLNRLTSNRADGALVRISTPITPETEFEGRSRLRSFGIALETQLRAHWPSEFAACDLGHGPNGAKADN